MNPFDQFDKIPSVDPMQASRDAILKRGAEMGFNPYGTLPEVKQDVAAVNPFDAFDSVAQEPIAKAPKPEMPKQPLGRTIFDQAMQGATFNFADEITDPLGATMAAIYQDPRALITGEFSDPAMAQEVAMARETTQDRLKSQMNDRPITSIASQIAGSIGTGVAGAGTKAGATMGNLLRSGGTAARIAKGAGVGAATGALYGAGAAQDGSKAQAAGEGAVLGGVVGGAIPAVGALVRSAAGGAKNVATGIMARGEDELNAAADYIKGKSTAAYQKMKDAGAVFNPQGTYKIMGSINRALAEEGEMIPELYKPIMAVVRSMNNAADKGRLGLQELDQYRQVLGQIAGNFTDKVNGQKATVLMKALDDAVEEVSDASYLSRGTQEAIDALKTGRAEWARQSKFNRIADIVKGASGDANKLKRDLERFRLNPKNTRGFSEKELEALKKAATQTTGEGVMKLIGKFGFDIGSGRAVGNGGLPAIGGIAGVGTMGGVGLAIPAVGTAARATQKGLASGKAENLLRVIEGMPPEARGKAVMLLPPKQAQAILNSGVFIPGLTSSMANQGVQ